MLLARLAIDGLPICVWASDGFDTQAFSAIEWKTRTVLGDIPQDGAGFCVEAFSEKQPPLEAVMRICF